MKPRGKPFQKGHGYLGGGMKKGGHHSEETKRKMSESHIGKRPYVMTDEIKENMRLAQIGKKRSPESIAKRVAKNTGKKRSDEARKNISESLKGDKSPSWKGGISKENDRIRKSVDFKLWREKVFERDNWTCCECDTRGGVLHPHHIKSFYEYPELRFEVNNGITLCVDCHRQTETWGRKVA